MDAAAAVAATIALEAPAHVQVFQGSLNESYTGAAGKKSYKAAAGAASAATTGSAAEQSVEVAAVKGKKENA